MIGRTLGQYLLVEKLGAGGMGEVYRAADTRLGRDVALKILPEAFARDPERLARFQREARVLAALNHPNIAAIYGFENLEGVPFLVLEYVPGPTLAERLQGGPIDAAESLDIARQITEAFAEAHEKAVVHRDLKPANVKVTPEGKVKVLDFGLAKAFAEAPESIDPGQSPTLSLGAAPTRAGVILGTAAYMSPEQARGKPLTRRTDIWSFGCVLYEMLAGRAAFRGETVTDIIAAVVGKEPDWSALPAGLAERIRELLRRCLQKDAARRLGDMLDARWEIDAAGQPGAAAPAAGLRNRERAAWALSAVLLVTALGLAAAHFRRPAADQAAIRFTILPPEKTTLAFDDPQLSPDGRRLAFLGTTEGRTRLWVRSFDSLAARPLPGTEGAEGTHFWSPDSRFLAFLTLGKLKKIDLAGGPAQTLCDAPGAFTGSWGPDGVILLGGRSGLSRVAVAGGAPVPLTRLDPSRQESSHGAPHFLPGGRRFLYTAYSRQGISTAYAGSLDGGVPKHLMDPGFKVLYAASPPAKTGHLLFERQDILMAQAFDAARLELIGEAFPVVENIRGFSASSTGVLAYRQATAGEKSRLTWKDRAGRTLGTVGEPGQYADVQLSPDEKRAAVTILEEAGAGGDVWLLDLARGVPTRFTFHPEFDSCSAWSPDGTRLVFSSQHSNRGGPRSLFQKPSSGAGEEEVLIKEGGGHLDDWSPDGRFLLFSGRSSSNTSADLWVLPLTRDRKPRPLLQTEFAEGLGQVSSDGRWLAYLSTESGRSEVYVRAFAPAAGSEASGKWRISTAGATAARWRGDGKEIFYTALDGKLMAVPVRAPPTGVSILEPGAPVELFATPLRTRLSAATTVDLIYHYDVTRDGQRFLMILPEESKEPEAIQLLVNWTAGLKK